MTAPDDSNMSENPLRSYRMAMLAHGFVDQQDSTEFKLDESDPMSYSVVRTRGSQVNGAWLLGMILLVVGAVPTVILLG